MDADERWRVLRLHVEDQVPLAALARDTGIGVRTLQRWHQRYQSGGIAALEQTPRTDAGQRRTHTALVAFIERLALTRPSAEHRYLAPSDGHRSGTTARARAELLDGTRHRASPGSGAGHLGSGGTRGLSGPV